MPCPQSCTQAAAQRLDAPQEAADGGCRGSLVPRAGAQPGVHTASGARCGWSPAACLPGLQNVGCCALPHVRGRVPWLLGRAQGWELPPSWSCPLALPTPASLQCPEAAGGHSAPSLLPLQPGAEPPTQELQSDSSRLEAPVRGTVAPWDPGPGGGGQAEAWGGHGHCEGGAEGQRASGAGEAGPVPWSPVGGWGRSRGLER